MDWSFIDPSVQQAMVVIRPPFRGAITTAKAPSALVAAERKKLDAAHPVKPIADVVKRAAPMHQHTMKGRVTCRGYFGK
jgi:hypothetical protein